MQKGSVLATESSTTRLKGGYQLRPAQFKNETIFGNYQNTKSEVQSECKQHDFRQRTLSASVQLTSTSLFAS